VRLFKRVLAAISQHGSDVLFWGCTTLAISNVIAGLNGPEQMQGQFFAMAVAFGATAGLLYLGEKPEE
jgi:hypothetical protein